MENGARMATVIFIDESRCTLTSGPDFILMDDSTIPHRVFLVNKFLESEDFRQIDWSVKSPDLYNMSGKAIGYPLREQSKA
ncbi:hypothetical protein TNCV_4431511 [Trichonephila clavipes]|nr:hypothetical protein TNCV_4431511 [Trichonephila clavipes]